MTKRVSEEIDGVDVFTYDTDLLAIVMADYRRPELLELAKLRKYRGLYKLNKLELAIIVADRLTAERDAQREIERIDAAPKVHQPEAAVIRKSDGERGEVLGHTFNAKDELQVHVRLTNPALVTNIVVAPENDFRADNTEKPSPDVIGQLHELAAAIDEKRTIARAYLCTPSDVVLTWAEIEQGYLDAMAECDRQEHNAAVRVEPVIGSDKWNAAMLSDEPRDLDIWLQPGVVFVGPQSGDRYRFNRWDPKAGGAVLTPLGADRRAPVVISQAEVTTWQYLPKASAEGIAEAKRRVPWRRTFVMHENTGQVYEVLGTDIIITGKLIISHVCGTKCSEHERFVTPRELQRDYRAVCEHGRGQECWLCPGRDAEPAASTYAVGDRVRWSEDRRLMFVRQVTPTGAYVSPTPDGPLAAFAAFEDLSPERGERVPDTREAWKAYAEKVKASRGAAEAKVAELLIERENVLAAWERMRRGLTWTLDALKARGADGSIGAAFVARQIEGVLQDGEL